MSDTAMPAELEQALRNIKPACAAARVREIRTLFGIRFFEEPCTEPASHILHVVCDGAHQPFPGQLMCAEHNAAFDAMRERGGVRHHCACGGTIIVETAAL